MAAKVPGRRALRAGSVGVFVIAGGIVVASRNAVGSASPGISSARVPAPSASGFARAAAKFRTEAQAPALPGVPPRRA
ncbi:hypothetical protein ACWDE0_21400 [Streptomyces sp. 900105755]|uniref:hypothetical protein n=1 Tax=Streptomyces sp. 900105755 TaxID=3154389 RepID=UPI00332899A2